MRMSVYQYLQADANDINVPASTNSVHVIYIIASRGNNRPHRSGNDDKRSMMFIQSYEIIS
jgi:hypothetical protein